MTVHVSRVARRQDSCTPVEPLEVRRISLQHLAPCSMPLGPIGRDGRTWTPEKEEDMGNIWAAIHSTSVHDGWFLRLCRGQIVMPMMLHMAIRAISHLKARVVL